MEANRENEPEPGFTARLHAGRLTLMMGVSTARTSAIVHIAHSTGHDALLLDLEHGTMSLDVVAELCATGLALGITTLVRIPEREYGIIGRVLDAGAQGIVVPRVETAEEARLIARACRFAPRGQRSQTPMVPQLGMKPTPPRLLNRLLDEQVVVQVMLETPAGIENAEAIAAVDGVDMITMGLFDLTAEFGAVGEFADPRVRDAIEVVGQACRKHGKLLMVGGIGDDELYRSLVPLGVCPLLLTGSDATLLYSGATSAVAKARHTFEAAFGEHS
jgi:2-keto-3-deoxy-L-rhamnonate aldolase RhmA